MISGQPPYGQRGGREAAQGETANDFPIGRAVTMMHEPAERFGNAGKPKVRADGNGGFAVEQEDQDWRHQRAAADASQPDEETDEGSGKRVGQVEMIHLSRLRPASATQRAPARPIRGGRSAGRAGRCRRGCRPAALPSMRLSVQAVRAARPRPGAQLSHSYWPPECR